MSKRPSKARPGAGSAFEQAAQGRPLSLQASTIYSYTLDIAAGQAWPFSLSEQIAALRAQFAAASRFEQLGNNLGFRVIIEPAFAVTKFTPVARGGRPAVRFRGGRSSRHCELLPCRVRAVREQRDRPAAV